MKPIVNTDAKMSKKMLDALTLFETYCVANIKSETTEQEVKSFLASLFSKNFADQFKPEYLYQ
jgi:hypothetical protein